MTLLSIPNYTDFHIVHLILKTEFSECVSQKYSFPARAHPALQNKKATIKDGDCVDYNGDIIHLILISREHFIFSC